jgi:hypothetical protein
MTARSGTASHRVRASAGADHPLVGVEREVDFPP